MTDSALHAKAEKALKQAVGKLVRDSRKTGSPLIVWRDGKVARLTLSSRKRSSRSR